MSTESDIGSIKKFVTSRNSMPWSLRVAIVTALIAEIVGNDAQWNTRIVGGQNVVITERPYMVSVQDDSGHQCGGSIIGKNVILTADHCVPNGNPTDYKVHSGSSYTFKNGTTTRVKRIYRERESPSGSKADVAILELEKSLEFGPTRQPIKLWRTDWEIYVEPVNVTGWGLTLMHSNGSWDGQLQTVLLQLVNWNECAPKTPRPLKLHEMCAWVIGGGKDACTGDSGGPMVIEDGETRAQVAIVAGGWDCGQPEVPGIYTNIVHVRGWIDRILRAVELINI